MMQSRFLSALESIANVMVGYIVAIVAQTIVFPIFDVYISMSDNLMIGAIFTLVSLVRSYFLRRVFNRIHA